VENQLKLQIIRILTVFFLLILFTACQVQQDLEFERDIVPIITNRCLTCHREKGIAPIELNSYAQLDKYRKNIILQVESGRMPPWPADQNYTKFVGQMCLRPGEKDTLISWLTNQTQNNTKSVSKEKIKIPHTSLPYPKPDTIISFGKRVFLKGDGLDKFFLISIPHNFLQDTVIKSIAFFPGNYSKVHHVNGHLVQYDSIDINVPRGTTVIPNDSLDPESAFTLMGLRNADGTFPTLTQSAFNYLPGVLPINYPDGIGGFKTKKHCSFLLRDIHYGPAYSDTSDISSIGIYFASKRPDRLTQEIQMGTLGITDIEPPLLIPAESVKKFTTRYPVTKDLSVLTVNPHMHRLGWSFKAFAYNDKGDTISLINIPKWDFNWQYFYTFVNPVHIPAGYVIQAVGEYNNTIHNPFNPFHPPKDVSERAGSMRTTDEMFQFILTVMDYRKGDESIKLDQVVPRGTK
jgi:hypothetical protein